VARVVTHPHRAGAVLLLAAALVALSAVTRLALLFHPNTGALGALEGVLAFLIGFLFDLVAAVFVSAPLFVLIVLAPDRLAATRAWRGLAR
jgi:hypothetical protein